MEKLKSMCYRKSKLDISLYNLKKAYELGVKLSK
jgi:hypothetical protein